MGSSEDDVGSNESGATEVLVEILERDGIGVAVEGGLIGWSVDRVNIFLGRWVALEIVLRRHLLHFCLDNEWTG